MLELNFIRNNLELVKDKVALKGIDFDPRRFSELDGRRRQLLTESESLQSRKNSLAKEIGVLRSQKQDTGELEKQSLELSTQIEKRAGELQGVEAEFDSLLIAIPNLPDESVPLGLDSTANQVIREWGRKPAFDFPVRPHWELGEKNGQLDFQRAAKTSASRFAFYFGALAKLERVLIQFMLETHSGLNGYCEVVPPFLVNDQSLVVTGNLPKFRADLFKVEEFNLYLVPTAEVPLTNIHRDETIDESRLPLNYVAYSPCFRSEAGSYGKEIRGLIRQHQFNKIELLKFAAPGQSTVELEKLTTDAESILQKLGLHYRVSALCSGDLSFSSAKTYDLEVWMPSRDGYLEISSCSNFKAFQARRARIKYKSRDGKKDFVHTLNGSGLAIGRTVAAIMENYQERDGRIRIPDALQAYFPGSSHF